MSRRKVPGRNGYKLLGAIALSIIFLCGVALFSKLFRNFRRSGTVDSKNDAKETPHESASSRQRKGSPACFKRPKMIQDRRKDRTRLKVVTFNAEWLFLFGENNYIPCPANSNDPRILKSSESTEGCPWKSINEAENHLKQVAAEIARIDADFVTILEVEDCRVLNVLLEALSEASNTCSGAESGSPNCGYVPYLIKSRDTATGQSIGILSRLDPLEDLGQVDHSVQMQIGSTRCVSREINAKDALKSIRPSKSFIFKIAPYFKGDTSSEIALIGLHLISRTRADNCLRREAQAYSVRREMESMKANVEKEKKENPDWIVLGDFNDGDSALVDASDQEPDSSALSIIRGSESAANSLRLINSLERIEKEKRFSAIFCSSKSPFSTRSKCHRSLVDHILLSPGLTIIDAGIENSRNSDPKSPKVYRERISDHFPVWAVIDTSFKKS
jgi:hypothetical protein